MDATQKNINGTPFADVNLKFILKKILRRKFLFLLSLALFLPLAYVYTKMATPVYKCATTIVIEAEQKRKVGIGGEEVLFENEKEKINVVNEVSIIQARDLIEKSLAPLGFEVSYFAGNIYGKKEKYGYFPVEVILNDTMPQLYGAYYEIIPKSDTEYELVVEADEFRVSNPKTQTNNEIEEKFKFQETFKYGQKVSHAYFNFIVKKPNYKVSAGAFKDHQLFFKLSTMTGLVKSFKGKLDVEQTNAAGSIIRLQTEGPVVKKQLLFLDQLSKNYIESKKQNREFSSTSKKEVIAQKLKDVSGFLATAEKNLESFLASPDRINIEATTNTSLDQIDRLESEKSELLANIDYYNQSYKYLEDSSGVDKITSPSLVGIDDPLLNENLLQLQSLHTELTKQSNFLGPESKDLALIKAKITSTTEQIKTSLSNLVKADRTKVNARDTRIAEFKQQISTLPTNIKQKIHLEREVNRFEKEFNYLTRELSNIEIAEIGNIPDARMLDAPQQKGDAPIAPKKKLIMVLGTMVGLLLPFLYVVLFDPYDEDITELKQLEKYSNIPVVGSVAHFSSKNGMFTSNVNSIWQMEESFRDVSANVQILLPDTQHNVIGITSTVPNEGKTFCALNMAINLASSGKSVLLIDSDLRNSDLVERIGEYAKTKKLGNGVLLANGSANGVAPNGKSKKGKDIVNKRGVWFEFIIDKPMKVYGLLNYLKGEVKEMSKVIHYFKDEPNLKFVLSSLIEDENPHRLLADKRLELLIKDASEQYDYVLIDSPPVGLVSDYLLVSKFVDLHLFVVRRNVSKISYLQAIEKIKRAGKLKNVRLLFNDVAGKALKYGYSNYSYGKVKK